tara:strand:+ start:3075 stop:3497 length:423 start_codon:yes stop_codon:yes gene_type:complete
MDRLKKIKKEIENMPKCHQIEVLRLCKKNNNILVNENNNGTFINLTEVNDIFLQKLEDYVSYVIEQKHELDVIEDKKYNLQNNFFNENMNLIHESSNINEKNNVFNHEDYENNDKSTKKIKKVKKINIKTEENNKVINRE